MASQKSSSKAGKKAPSKIASIKEALFGGKKKNDKGHDGNKKAAHGAKTPQSLGKPGKVAAKGGAPHSQKNVAHSPKKGGMTQPSKATGSVKHVPATKVAAGKANPPAAAKTHPTAAAPKASVHGKSAAPAAASTKAAPQKALPSVIKRKGDGSLKGSLRGASVLEAEAVCREVACEGLATTAGYCRLHYIKNWKKIKRKELILKEGKLNQYIEELVAKYPDKYIEAIRQDLASDKDFAKVIYDLDLDEGVDDFDVDGESIDSVIDTIKRDFDDEGEGGF